jgi:hypothetical protein
MKQNEWGIKILQFRKAKNNPLLAAIATLLIKE